jgi:hypothetical protein
VFTVVLLRDISSKSLFVGDPDFKSWSSKASGLVGEVSGVEVGMACDSY